MAQPVVHRFSWSASWQRVRWLALFVPLLLLAASVSATEERDDLLIADFEGQDYGAWKAQGDAFGPRPARGVLPGQMAVDGFLGHGLVNSFHGGDAATGTLTSPTFRIERPYIVFLIGGGKHPGETCLNLLIDGAVVRSATGPNDRPGGSERLDWVSWDVSDLAGRPAVLEVVDRHTGGWGHVNVDQIVQSDRPRGLAPVRRELTANARFLHLPVCHGAAERRMRVAVDGRTVREFDVKLADAVPDFWVFLDLAAWRGKRLRIETDLPAGSEALDRVAQADQIPGVDGLYREAARPQFHFTSRRGWLNDPNGLVWHAGEYHLFYQHNPYGWDWGNMHWGHAVSPDLVHWTELPIALYPRQYGDWAFSGSAVVDRENTSGFGKEKAPPLVLAYTSTARGECIAFSNDRGRTWSELDGNPVVRHRGRDPRLLWHEPTRRWVMAVYDEDDRRQSIDFYTSPDLKAWTFASRIDGFFECPDLFELPVLGEPGRALWVLSAADGEYMLGRFDGRTFTRESGKHRLWHGEFYAAQSFSDTPDGRRVQIGWARGGTFPGMPFNQQMCVPCELTLRPTDQGVRMFAQPVAELTSLRGKGQSLRDAAIGDAQRALRDFKADLAEIRAEIAVSDSGTFRLDARGVPITYDGGKQTLSCGPHVAPLAATAGLVRLRILVDRGSIEVFGGDGRVAISRAAVLPSDNRTFGLSGTDVRVQALDLHELHGAWTVPHPSQP